MYHFGVTYPFSPFNPFTHRGISILALLTTGHVNSPRLRKSHIRMLHEVGAPEGAGQEKKP